MLIAQEEACALLGARDKIVILSHAKPDGDTLGSAFALLYALEKLGKTARVESPDGFPDRYRFFYEEYAPKAFDPDFVVAVDVAGMQLLGNLADAYRERVDLCIDHHQSNEGYAKATLLDVEAAATTEIVYAVALGLGIRPDPLIADAVFTGLTTDTGGFRYSNVTARTHRIAGEMIGWGARHAEINKWMFHTKSRGRVAVDRLILEQLQFHFEGKCASILVPADICSRFGVSEEELDGISALPCTIEGVQAGITLRDKGNGAFRVSLRSAGEADVSRVCALFGGGGHHNAAGCTISGEAGQVLEQLLAAVGQELGRPASNGGGQGAGAKAPVNI